MCIHFFGTLCTYICIYTEGAQKMYTHFKRCYLCKMCKLFWAPSIYMCTEGAKKSIHIRGCQKMYTHFKRCYLCKMCIHFWHPLYIYIYMYRGCQKSIHILRDVIYVKYIYIFWHPLYIYIYMYRGCQKMYTHQRVPKNVYTF